jgi:hypothetical protein
MITDYCGGMNVMSFSQAQFHERAQRDAISGRGDNASFVWLMEPPTRRDLDGMINLSGTHEYTAYGYQDDPVRAKVRHYTNCDWARSYWGFAHFSKHISRVHATRVPTGLDNPHPYNLLCFRDHSRLWHPGYKGFNYVQTSVSGFVPDEKVGPGMVQVWKSHLNYYPSQDRSNVEFI